MRRTSHRVCIDKHRISISASKIFADFLRVREARWSKFSTKGKLKMRNNFEQYGTLLDSASEATEACLDMEGGAFFWSGLEI